MTKRNYYDEQVNIQDVVLFYETRLKDLEVGIVQFRTHHMAWVGVLIIAIAAFLTLGAYVMRGHHSGVWPSLPIPIAAAALRKARRSRDSGSRMWRLKRFYDRGLSRIRGTWAGFGATGMEYSEPDHVFAKDLDVLGEGSLFELLCTARTSIGRRGLAKYLLHGASPREITLRQDAVRELREQTELREHVAALGEFEFLESRPEVFEEWLDSPPLKVSRVPTVMVATLLLFAGLIGAASTAMITGSEFRLGVGVILAIHSALGIAYRERVNRAIECQRQLLDETVVLREGLHLLEGQKFDSVKLQRLCEQARGGSATLRKLEFLLEIVAQRNKEFFYAISRFFLTGTLVCMATERWRREHGETLRIWLYAWAEFEALNSIAAYAFENPDNAFPELISDVACFEGRELGHPLLPSASCVRNDVILNIQSRINVISGSNMSGKSTLLRAIGVNAVLAFAGAPVRAMSLRLSNLSVFASFSIGDSLMQGKSKFMAEVNRIRQAIEAGAEGRSVLFLIDEIFSGTNSRDRRIAAEAVVRTLLSQNSIGALSTHDLTLTEIADVEGIRGVNVHMGSKNEQDPMDFDYKLKPGVTTEASALAIARLAGVEI